MKKTLAQTQKKMLERGEQGMKEIVSPEGLWMPLGVYSHAVKVKGNQFLFMSGVTSRDKDGTVVGQGDFQFQIRKIFENMEVILKCAGAGFENIVKMTTYVTDTSHYAEIQEVRSRYFKGDYPASTLVQVKQLSSPDLLIEVEAIAVL